MDTHDPQRAPDWGVTRLRIGERLWEMPDPIWEHWVRQGRVPPDALVLSNHWTRGLWRRAETLEVYHLFRPSQTAREAAEQPGSAVSGNAGATGEGGEEIPAGKPGSLPVAIWGPGISVTQVLVLANLVVSAALVFFWKEGYSDHLWGLSGRLRAQLVQGWIPVLLIPLFLHASSSHLMGNMVGLVAAGAAVEEFYGRLRTLLLYFFAGLCGAAMSLLRPKPVLSVGASGAIMGLYGVVLVFLLRNRKHFSDRQKMKTNRVYLPLLVLAVFPSLFMADFYSHLGGFLGGVLLALLLSPVKERLPWAAASGSPAAVAPGAGIHSGSGNRFGPGHDPPRHES